MGSPPLRPPRYNVNLAITFASAIEFVTEYAENLSSSGLFIRGGDGLKPLDELGVTLNLPGLGAFVVGVRVAHVMPHEVAARFNKRPPGFDDAMSEYLRRLGARHDHAVICHDDEPFAYFDRMGYQARAMPGMGELVGSITRSKQTVLAVVVPRGAERLFRTMLERAGADDLLHVAETAEELDALLTELDQRL
jgi:hypothetical protein